MRKSQCGSNPHKRMIKNASKITNFFIYFQSAATCLKDFYLKKCTSFLMKMTIIIQPVRLLTQWLFPKSTPFYHPLNICRSDLDSKLKFNQYINHILSKANKSVGSLRKFQLILPRSSLLTIYKTFIGSHFNYADVVSDQSYKLLFHEKLDLSQYNAALTVTGTVKGSFSE